MIITGNNIKLANNLVESFKASHFKYTLIIITIRLNEYLLLTKSLEK